MHRKHMIAAALAGFLLFALGLTGIQETDEPDEWLTAYNAAMTARTPGP
jgi:hypothetical protein